ncbi:MAG: Do family serine endopeptidase [Saprospiraceae bacterium]|nr:Do family serine endopeptidase [Saprospiraceae bacterium]
MKKISSIVLASLLGAIIALGGARFLGFQNTVVVKSTAPEVQAKFASLGAYENSPVIDFTVAADKTLPAVVHIKSSIRVDQPLAQGFEWQNLPDPFRQFFESPYQQQNDNQQQQPQRQPNVQEASGSGVIISADGYIVTNNHVVADAEELTVTLNDHRSYTAKLIGTDPSTDVALIKIDEDHLPSIQFANSDALRVGEWVVAVGNPFNLESTVTAGIVSAKARNINIMHDKSPIESFIQTDAAINPGNSGGALVNLQGQLVGVNTAIASPTGSYTGYGFAVPSNIVRKIITDLKEYGVVQRGYLGAMIRNIDSKLAEEKGLARTEGVYIDSLTANSAAEEAGIRVNDVVTAVDENPINTMPELLEMIGRHRPGDQINITLDRKGVEKQVKVTLRNREGNTEIVKKDDVSAIVDRLGATFAALTSDEAAKMHIKGGVKVKDLGSGILSRDNDMREGFVITKIDNREVTKPQDLGKILQGKSGGIMLEGRYPGSSETFYYAFGL